MKKIFFLLVMLALILSACSGVSFPNEDSGTQPEVEDVVVSDTGADAHTERFLAAIEGCEYGEKESNALTGEVVCNDPPDCKQVEVEDEAVPLKEPEKVAKEPEYVGGLFKTPVECQESFDEGSAWLICEPGVILDDTAAWVIPSVDATHFVNIPEGGFTFFSIGEGVISVDGVDLKLPGAEGLNYTVVIRGRIDDTIVDNDLNITAEVTDFVPGHAIWSIMPPGAYVSKGWFLQQLVTSTTTGGTNCGATGCSTVKVVLFDVDSHFMQVFEVKAGDLDNWKLLE